MPSFHGQPSYCPCSPLWPRLSKSAVLAQATFVSLYRDLLVNEASRVLLGHLGSR